MDTIVAASFIKKKYSEKIQCNGEEYLMAKYQTGNDETGIKKGITVMSVEAGFQLGFSVFP